MLLKKDNNSENFISIMKFNIRVMYYQDFELEFMAFLNKLWFVYSFFNKLYGFYFVTFCLWLLIKFMAFTL